LFRKIDALGRRRQVNKKTFNALPLLRHEVENTRGNANETS